MGKVIVKAVLVAVLICMAPIVIGLAIFAWPVFLMLMGILMPGCVIGAVVGYKSKKGDEKKK